MDFAPMNGSDTEKDIESGFHGGLCRCPNNYQSYSPTKVYLMYPVPQSYKTCRSMTLINVHFPGPTNDVRVMSS